MAAWQAGAAHTLTADEVGAWVRRVDLAAAKAREFYPQWERSLKRYAEAKVPAVRRTINALKDYKHVESKRADLFHRTPEVSLVPPPGSPLIPVLAKRQQVLNYELGPSGANAKRALHQTLVDTLAASGFMIIKVGYEQVSIPDPVTQVPIPIWSRRFLSPVSGKRFLVPADWHSTVFDEAPWLGMRGVMPIRAARRANWTLSPGTEGATLTDDAVYGATEGGQAESQEDAVSFTEIWYRAAAFDDDVVHPELFRCLILISGQDEPAKCVNSPYQFTTPEGSLTDDSLQGNVFHVGTLRDLIDSAYVPSDLVIGEQLTQEINEFREEAIWGKRSRRPLTLIDADGLDAATIRKIELNAGPIVTPAGWLTQKDTRFLQITPGGVPRDDYTAQDYAERDLEEALGKSANQSGSFTRGRRTATEVRTVQGNASARAQTEQDRIRDYFVALVRKYDCLLTQTATPAEIVKILGTEAAALWEQWRALPGQYGYTVLPDAGQYVDAREHRSATLESYNLLRKDERVNVEDLLTMVAQALHRDPTTFIAPAQDKTTDPPQASIGFNPLDLNDPVVGRLFLDLCANGGIKLSAGLIQMMAQRHADVQAAATLNGIVGAEASPTTHGGSATRTEKVNQHQSERTGGVQGVVQ